MARFSSEEPEGGCDRCGTGLTTEHWVCLRAEHRGQLADWYTASEKRICADCLAALGMLDLDVGKWAAGRQGERPDSVRNSVGS